LKMSDESPELLQTSKYIDEGANPGKAMVELQRNG
jgi:hypothetical protein